MHGSTHLLIATSLCSLLTVSFLSLGVAILAAPSQLVRVLFPCLEAEERYHLSTLEFTLARLSGGILSSLGLSSLLLLLPIFCCQRGKNINESISTSSAVDKCRAALSSQAVVGLVLVIVALIDDNEDRGTDAGRGMGGSCGEFKAASLLIGGASILVVAGTALMASFWPASEQPISPSDVSSARGTARCWCFRKLRVAPDDSLEIDNTTPLLHADERDGDEELQAGSDPVESSHLQQTTNSGSTDEQNMSTSRITGTRRLMKMAAPQMLYLYIGCAVLLIRLPFSLSIPHFVSTTLSALARQDYDAARMDILLLFILGTIDAALDFWCVFLFGYAKERIVKGVRLDTFSSILKQEVAFFDLHNSGDLSSRLNSDCGEMAGDLTWFFRFSIESIVRISGIMIYMLVRSPLLGLCAVSIAPIVAVINKKYGEWLAKNAKEVQNALAEANAVAQQAFSCVRTVIAFASESFEHEKYCGKIERQYRLMIRQLYASGVYYMVISTFLVNTCVQAALLLIGTVLIERNRLTPDVLLAFMLYQGQLQEYVMNLLQSYSSLIQSSGAGDKVFGLLDRSPPPPGTGSSDVLVTESDEDDSIHHKTSQNSVQLCDIVFSYPSRPSHPVLRGLNMDIPAGSTVALVGPSGCGKSTIIGLLQRFYDPVSGSVLIDGVDLRTVDIKLHRRHIGVVTQDPILFTGTILSNITYGSVTATRDEAIEAAKLANAHNFIESFPDGYDTEVGERGVQLSGGQKQRIAISRAVIKNPSLLLLDEATSALDSESEQVVQDALDRLLNVNKDMTTVVVAHRLQTVRNADCIAFIQEGVVAEKGTHDELMQDATGLYRRMVERANARGQLPED